MLTDITWHRQAEEALRESEERYRALFLGAAEGILVADIDTRRIVHANPAISMMLGYGEGELIGKGLDEIHPEESFPQVIREFEALVQEEKSRGSRYTVPEKRRDDYIHRCYLITTYH